MNSFPKKKTLIVPTYDTILMVRFVKDVNSKASFHKMRKKLICIKYFLCIEGRIDFVYLQHVRF